MQVSEHTAEALMTSFRFGTSASKLSSQLASSQISTRMILISISGGMSAAVAVGASRYRYLKIVAVRMVQMVRYRMYRGTYSEVVAGGRV